MNDTDQNHNNEKDIQIDQKDKQEKIGWKDVVSFVLLVLIIVVPIRMFVAQPFIVDGDSMLPNFHTGEYLIVDQLTYHISDPERGDIIVFRFPQEQKRFFIKRIIGLPGETVEISGTEVKIINSDNPGGFILSEPHITLQKESGVTTTLGSDEYFVMGDNRIASLDSRIWGALSKDLIIGRAYLRLLPIDKVDYLPAKVDYSI